MSVKEKYGPSDADDLDIKSFLSYAIKVLWYMALKEARKTPHAEYSATRSRLERVAAKKKAKVSQRLASQYDGIVIGPETLPTQLEGGHTVGHALAPHWRRGPFRMHPHGRENSMRKLIFVSPLLVHAHQLSGETPRPRAYRASR